MSIKTLAYETVVSTPGEGYPDIYAIVRNHSEYQSSFAIYINSLYSSTTFRCNLFVCREAKTVFMIHSYGEYSDDERDAAFGDIIDDLGLDFEKQQILSVLNVFFTDYDIHVYFRPSKFDRLVDAQEKVPLPKWTRVDPTFWSPKIAAATEEVLFNDMNKWDIGLNRVEM